LVERIRITPQQIITRNASGNETFNTNNLYLKTDPSGELYAGGNTRSPMIYGQNNVADDTSSGFFAGTTYFYSTFFTGAMTTRVIEYEVPAMSGTPTLVFSNAWIPVQGYRVFESPTWRSINYYNYNTGTVTNTQGIYKWQLTYFGKNDGLTDSYGNPAFSIVNLMIYPIISNLPGGPLNPAGGIFQLNYEPSEHSNYTTTVVDGYGNATVRTLGQLGPYNSALVYNRPHSLYSFRNPTLIALAVTP
jgi:hypothetical protein